MTATRRIVMNISLEIYRKMETRAAERNLDAGEWALRALLAALSRPESKATRERRSREAGLALLSLLAGRPPEESSFAQGATEDRRKP